MVLYLREQEANVEERGRELRHFLEFPEFVFVFSKTNVIFIKGRQMSLIILYTFVVQIRIFFW